MLKELNRYTHKEDDVGSWSDEHPLNHSGAEKTNYIEKVFI